MAVRNFTELGAERYASRRVVRYGALWRENARLRELLKAAELAASRSVVMLQEGDHRIKNSLQVVAGLMRMQARRETSDPAREALMAAATRIQSIAGIHASLHGGAGEDVVDLGEVIETLCRALQSMGGEERGVTVVVESESIRAPVAFAQPIMLLVSELVVNALRHAFPDNRGGVVHVSVARECDELCIVVADDGVGLPVGAAADGGYGLSLVRAMTAQVGGVLAVKSYGGARFTLTAPAPTVAMIALRT